MDATVWINFEDKRTNAILLYYMRSLRVVKFIGQRMVVAKGCGEGESGVV